MVHRCSMGPKCPSPSTGIVRVPVSRATLAIVCCSTERVNVPKTCVNGFGNADELAHLRGSQGVDHVLPDVGRVPWRCLADLAPPNIGEARIGGTGDLPPVRLALGITAGAGRSVALFYAGILELIASILITAGLFTRTAAFVASGVMAFAFFTQHLPTGVIR